ncbi:MAG TPA: 3'(2'),5'-bisphosphate nucleotidase [Prolixibacteraceae bacterium]|jgi:3'(2'), 5'-bisphosphate nucleotidase|nr:3'(2'),5'-bisphosphate nucleotidase [Prolixibacteraceae bacterium]
MGTHQLINIAINAALLAGEKIMEVYASGDFAVTQKDDLSPLTAADLQAHLMISSLLEPTQIPILSEEGIHLAFTERAQWKTFWLVDPLDGTKEFISRNGEFTVNIALIEDNKSIAGIIYCPVSKELYVGLVGSGAWKIEHPELDCTFDWISTHGNRLPLTRMKDQYTVAVSRTHLDDQTIAYIDELKMLHPELQLISRGSSLKFCLLAEGTADIYPRFGPTMEWDTAAGHAIVKAIGKNVFQSDQHTELHYNKENLMNPHFIVL